MPEDAKCSEELSKAVARLNAQVAGLIAYVGASSNPVPEENMAIVKKIAEKIARSAALGFGTDVSDAIAVETVENLQASAKRFPYAKLR